jgi:hypothetical protein
MAVNREDTYVISVYHHLRGEFESRSGELYSIQHRVTCGRSVDSSTNKTDRHDIVEILLKVALDIITITQVVVIGTDYISCIQIHVNNSR